MASYNIQNTNRESNIRAVFPVTFLVIACRNNALFFWNIGIKMTCAAFASWVSQRIGASGIT